MNLKNEISKISRNAKEASRELATLKTSRKNKILQEMAKSVERSKAAIKKANSVDLRNAERCKLSSAFMDRLKLNDKRIKGMADSIESISKLKDPVGVVEEVRNRPNGLVIKKVRVPIGVICVIYESRPNVTADCVALCLKSGNGLILRGGREAINSNRAIFNALNDSGLKNGLPGNAMALVGTTDRKAVDILLSQEGVIDLAIPRGGESLIKEVSKKAKIPVIRHYKGVCHVYVDDYADLNMAESVSFNAKVERPGVCNAMETLLVHEGVAARFLPSMAKKFIDAGVEIRGCPLTKRILRNYDITPARESDWSAEYLDLIVSVKVVKSAAEAIGHINKYGTSHSDAIITDNKERAAEFTGKVDSGSVYVNASTRFTDGHEFGKGAEIGISTDKIHARGPMGTEELTTYKYVIFGNGQIRK